MRHFYPVLIGLVFFCLKTTGQNVPLSGTVKDSIGNPLELANVVAINQKTNGIASYGITNYEGKFKLQLQMGESYLLRASYLGFETFEETIEVTSESLPQKNIVLKEKPNRLGAVEVVHEMPVSVSGDTIIYKADAFAKGNEKKLEDVLENLPGFEIDENGQVKVQGKTVEKVLVEGKEFFDGDTKMATQNIPADAVDKVQVLQNFNEVSQLKGLGNDEDRLALNIKLKDGKKNLLFGDVAAGAGPDGRYLVHPNLFYYTPKGSINFIGDANNIGKQAFTMMDYFRFNGGFGNLNERSGASLLLAQDDSGLAFMENNRARNIETLLGALNFSYYPNKKWAFSGFGIVNEVDTDMNSVSQRTYIREEGNNNELLTSGIQQKNVSTLAKFKANYKPNSSFQAVYEGYLKHADINQENQRLSRFDAFENTIAGALERQPFSIQQSLEAYLAKSEKNIWSFEANHLYKEQDALYDVTTSERPFNNLLPLEDAEDYRLQQVENITTHKLDALLNYFYVLNRTNHINVTMGTTFVNQQLNSGLAQINNGISNPFDDENLNNNVAFSFTDFYVGSRYKTKLGKFTLSPGLNLHFFRNKNEQLGTTSFNNKALLLPDFFAKFEIRQAQNITFNYGIKAEFPDIRNLAEGTILQSYNSLFEGNRTLENSWYHNFQLNYTNFNMFNFTNIYGGITYQKRYDNIVTGVNYAGLDRVSFPFNINSPNEVLSGYGNYQKRFTFMKIAADANWSYSKFFNEVDGNLNRNTSFTQSYTLSAETNFKKWPNAEVGLRKVFNRYEGSGIKNTFVTTRPYGNVEVSFLKHFVLTADYEYNDYRNKNGGNGSQFDFLNAALYYQGKDSPWEFTLSGLNLLNTTSIRQDGFSDNLISTYEYFVQPRYFMLGVKYKL